MMLLLEVSYAFIAWVCNIYIVWDQNLLVGYLSENSHGEIIATGESVLYESANCTLHGGQFLKVISTTNLFKIKK